MRLSNDIRERIVAAAKAGGTLLAIAERFVVGVSSIQRLVKLERQTGSIEPKSRGGGMKPRISDAMLPELVVLVEEKPDRTTSQLRDEWKKRTGVDMSHPSMIRSLRRAKITFKKNFSGGRARL